MADVTIPSDKQPIVNPKDGKIDGNWFNRLNELVRVINDQQAQITALEARIAALE